jgi:hypothetical protein
MRTRRILWSRWLTWVSPHSECPPETEAEHRLLLFQAIRHLTRDDPSTFATIWWHPATMAGSLAPLFGQTPSFCPPGLKNDETRPS